MKKKIQLIKALMRSVALTLAASSLLSATPIKAANINWSGAGGSGVSGGLWSDPANWAGTAPASGDALIFDASAGANLNTNNDLPAGTQIQKISSVMTGSQLNSGSYTHAGNAVTITQQIYHGNTGLQTFNLPLNLAGAVEILEDKTGQGIVLNGAVSGSGVLTVRAINTTSSSQDVTITAASSYSGTVNVCGSRLGLSGAGGGLNSCTVINIGANLDLYPSLATPYSRLVMDNTTGVADRVNDTAAITLFNEGELNLIANGAAATTETVGTVAMGTAQASSAATITLSGAAPGTVSALVASSLQRNLLSTCLIRGTQLGQAPANAAALKLVDGGVGLSQVGSTVANGSVPGTSTSLKIVPWLIGGASDTSAGSDFMTYDQTSGLRPLATAEYKRLSASYSSPTNSENCLAFSGGITAANPVVNSLKFDSAGTLSGSGPLWVKSGAIAATTASTSSTISSSFNGANGLLLGDTNTVNEGVIHVPQVTTSLTIAASINVTGGGGITKSGQGFLYLKSSNQYQGTTQINEGWIIVSDPGSLGTTSSPTIINYTDFGGCLCLQGGVNIPESVIVTGGDNSVGPHTPAIRSDDNTNVTLSGLVTLQNNSHIRMYAGGTGSLNFSGGIKRVDGSSGHLYLASGTGGTYLFSSAIDLNGASIFAAGDLNHLDMVSTYNMNATGHDVGGVVLYANSRFKIGVDEPFTARLPQVTIGSQGGNIGGGTLDMAGKTMTIAGLTGAPNPTDPSTTTANRIVTNSATGSASILKLLGTEGTSTYVYDGVIQDGAGQLSVYCIGRSQNLSGTAPNTYTGDTMLIGVSGQSSPLMEVSKSPGVIAIPGDVHLMANTNAQNTNSGKFTLRLRSDEQIADTGRIYFEGGTDQDNTTCALVLFGHVETIGGLISASPGAGRVRNSGGNTGGDTVAGHASLILNVTSGRMCNFSGRIYDNNGVDGTIGDVAITKRGLGTQIFSSPNTYSMGTTVNEGVLIVDNSTGSGTGTGSVTVAASGTLGGNGAVIPTGGNGVAVSGAISPGNPTLNSGVGKLTLGVLDLSGGGNYPCQISGGTTDTLAVQGSLNVTNAVLNVTANTPTSLVYIIASYGSLTGTFSTITGVPSGYVIDYQFGGNSIALVSNPYQSWLQANGISSNLGAFGQDPDNDGWSNLLEYALAGNPAVSEPKQSKLRWSIDSLSSSKYFTITVPVLDGAVFAGTPLAASAGVVNYVIHSSDLVTQDLFNAQEVTPAISSGLPALSAGWSYRSFRISSAIGNPAMTGFIWVEVNTP